MHACVHIGRKKVATPNGSDQARFVIAQFYIKILDIGKRQMDLWLQLIFSSYQLPHSIQIKIKQSLLEVNKSVLHSTNAIGKF